MNVVLNQNLNEVTVSLWKILTAGDLEMDWPLKLSPFLFHNCDS